MKLQIRELWQLMRPYQLFKSIFVFAGIFFSKQLNNPVLFGKVFVAAVAFFLISSVAYILNDVVDRDIDKMNPKKMKRPIPAGTISV
jgi:decaprenyl-phosphate phosphoribosyltransferase